MPKKFGALCLTASVGVKGAKPLTASAEAEHSTRSEGKAPRPVFARKEARGNSAPQQPQTERPPFFAAIDGTHDLLSGEGGERQGGRRRRAARPEATAEGERQGGEAEPHPDKRPLIVIRSGAEADGSQKVKPARTRAEKEQTRHAFACHSLFFTNLSHFVTNLSFYAILFRHHSMLW